MWLKVSISSKMKKHDPTYYLTVTTTTPSKGESSWQIRAPFTTWFTADGFFVAKPFQQWLASSVEAIGDVDGKNAGRDERDELAAPTAEVERIEQGNGSATATGTEGKGKASKKGKKKG
jgi:signal peptidase complex subunit 2